MSNNAPEGDQPAGDDGWMTVERKKEPKILARKGKRGISWRIPNDNENRRTRRSGSGSGKKDNRQRAFSGRGSKTKSIAEKQEGATEGKKAPEGAETSHDRPVKKTPVSTKTKPSESSWVAAARRGAGNNRRTRFAGMGSATNGMPKRSTPGSKGFDGKGKYSSRQNSGDGSEEDGGGNSGQIPRGKLKLRKQLQQILFTNVNQAVDELYYICEFDSEIESATAALDLMTGWRDNFQALVDTVRLQKEFESLNNSSKEIDLEDSLESSGSALLNKKGSVAWEITKSSPTTLSGINQIIESVLRRAATKPEASPQIVASLRPYADSLDRSSSPPLAEGEQAHVGEQGGANREATPQKEGDEGEQAVIGEEELRKELLQSPQQEGTGDGAPTTAAANMSTTAVLEMLRLDNTTSTGLWGDMLDSSSEEDDDDEEEAEPSMVAAPPSPPRSSPEQQTRSLHAKLSSPDRAKPTPTEAHQRMIQKHSLARINRERLQSEKREKLAAKNNQLKSSKEQRENILAEKESNMRKKLDTAEARRQDQLKLRMQSAISELDKVQEVSFINTLSQQTKAVQLQKKLDDSMGRRQDMFLEKIAKQRERRLKVEHTADDLRSKMQKEIDGRKVVLQSRLQKAEAQRQERLNRGAAQRKLKEERVIQRRQKMKEDAKAEREARRKSIQEREAKAAKVRNDQMKARLEKSKKEEEDNSQRRKVLEEEAQAELHAKKMEMKIKAERAKLKHERHIQARAANAELRRPANPSPRNSIDGFPGSSLPRSSSGGGSSPKRSSPKRNSPSRKKMENNNMPVHANAALAENEETQPSQQTLADRLKQAAELTSASSKKKKNAEGKAKKKLVRKCKQRLAAFWADKPFAEKETDATAGQVKKKVARLFADFAAMGQRGEDTGAILRDLVHATKKEPFDEATAKLFRVSSAFSVALSLCNREMSEKSPHLVNDAMRLIGLALAKNMESRLFFHAACAIESSSGVLGFALRDALVRANKSNRAEWKSSLLVTALETISMAIDFSAGSDSIPPEYRENIGKLYSLAGHVEKLGELFRVYESNSDNGKWAKQTSEIVVEGLQFMRVVAGSLVRRDQDLLATNPSSVTATSFGDACISGLVSILFSMTDGRGTWQAEVAIRTLDVLNTIARLDLQMFQTSLSSSSVQPQFYHVLNFLLDKGVASDSNSADFADVLIRKTLVLTGFHGVMNKINQESLNWGTQPTALQKICSLPFRFFNTDENKECLFPTLIAVCYNNTRNTSVVEQELSADLLVEYVNMYRTEKGSVAEDNKENEKMKAKEGLAGKIDNGTLDEIEIGVVDSLEWGLSERFPKSLWTEAVAFFEAIE
jgi:hypothetical protein